MTQSSQSINTHIETYLDYYCGLSHAPGFAILLKGKWGCGKTWFINKYREKLENGNKKQKCLYVSLYGMTSFSEIENIFFQQLFPIRSSKAASITGKVLQGLIKASLKIDLNNDGKDDTVSLQIPKIELPKSFENVDNSILIFDDLERCQIDIGNLLGYINYFVEHQGLKVILVANEDKLLENSNYKDIKEKLIGKIFHVVLDLEGALQDFIQECNNPDIKSFLSDNKELIEEIYQQAEYENLRSLKQIILDFERIFQELPEKAKNKSELLLDILKLLTAFSIEIKRGKLLPKNISKIQEAVTFKYNQARANFFQRSDNDDTKISEYNNQHLTSLKVIIDRYTFLNLLIYTPFPSLVWWQTFFDKGIINTSELNESILNSKYFPDENTPNWMRLWHFNNTDMADDEFDDLLEKVELEYVNREFIDIGEIKHVTGLFLHLSDSGLYPSKSKQELLRNSKLYINDLIANNKFDLNLVSPSNSSSPLGTGYKGLGFQGIKLEEFKEFCSYIKTARQSAIEERLPQLGLELLDIMQQDKRQFYRMLCINNFPECKEFDRIYCKIPILKYIGTTEFINRFLSMNFDYQSSCLWTFAERYKANNLNEKLLEELEWLKNIQSLLLVEAARRKGKLSGYRLELLDKEYLSQAIKKLEESQVSSLSNNGSTK